MRTASVQSRLCELFDRSGMKDVDIASALGVSKQAVSGWRSGLRSPKKSALIRIADYFQVDVSWLLGWDPLPPAKPVALTDEENQLLGLFQQLNRQGRDLLLQTAVTAVASGMYSNHD